MPFGVEIAQLMVDKNRTIHNVTVMRCIRALLQFYMSLTVDPFKPELASSSCETFSTFYSALSEEAAKKHDNDVFWKVKPKHHMFCELAQYQCAELGNPSMYWNYSDEYFVGWIASLALSRGGPKNASTTSKKVLDRYRILSDV